MNELPSARVGGPPAHPLPGRHVQLGEGQACKRACAEPVSCRWCPDAACSDGCMRARARRGCRRDRFRRARAVERRLDRLPRYAPSDAGAQILSASVRGGEQRLLVRGTSLAAGVALSRNGKRIAFVRKGPGGPAVWVSRADGRGARRLARGTHPGWSPDGRWVVFLGGRRLMTVRVDGSELRELVRAERSSDVQPVWSPAGGWIAYVAPISSSGSFVPAAHSPAASRRWAARTPGSLSVGPRTDGAWRMWTPPATSPPSR